MLSLGHRVSLTLDSLCVSKNLLHNKPPPNLVMVRFPSWICVWRMCLYVHLLVQFPVFRDYHLEIRTHKILHLCPNGIHEKLKFPVCIPVIPLLCHLSISSVILQEKYEVSFCGICVHGGMIFLQPFLLVMFYTYK